MTDDTIIKVEGLSKKYRRYGSVAEGVKELFHPFRKRYHKEFWALRDVSFEVKRGESLGIVGRNGSGKSTLLQILCGVIQKTSGSVEVGGKVAALLELGAGFHPEFSGRENVFLQGALMGLSKEEIEARFDDIAAFADIGDFIDEPVRTYSSGMFVRLAFSAAINVDPDVLIVDEALSVGDIAFQQKCLEQIAILQGKGVTIVLVTHDIHMVKNYCTKALYLNSGRLVTQGETESTTEAYLKDFFSEQQGGGKGSGKVSWKERGGTKSFGTEHGELQEFSLWRGEERADTFRPGDKLTVRISFWVDETVVNPKVTIQLRDVRGYPVYGTDSLALGVVFAPESRKDGVLNVLFSFDVRLAPEPYAFVIGLTDHVSDSIVIVHEKVIGALGFTVLEGDRKFHGVVDLEADCEVYQIDDDEFKTIKHRKGVSGNYGKESVEKDKIDAGVPYGDYDIGEGCLRAALDVSPFPDMLIDLVRISRKNFGWFTKQETRVFEIPWIVKEARNLMDLRIMDIGSGVSPLPLYFAEKGAKVTTVDSSHIIRRLSVDQESWDEWGFLDYSLLNKNIESFNDDILSKDFPGGYFDCIYSVSVIEHLPASARRRLWEKVSEWLKKDGRLLLTVDMVPESELLWNYCMGEVVEPHEEHGDLKGLEDELSSVGLDLKESELLRGVEHSRVDCAFLVFQKKG